MAPDRWKQINDVFERAAALPPHEREAFLETACGSDLDLREEVRSLLAYDNNAQGFLRNPTTPIDSRLVAVPAADLAGRRIGSYRLIQQIATGGMGSVWLADRADQQFNKQVAIKLIKRGMDTDEVLRRFHAERQVLARLEHPNIARLHDGGATDDGLPYLVMEHIHGTPLDEYCNHHSLTIHARLELFRHVCDAVQFAHRNLVVHRDLKPANILITSNGEVKLLDFGIAKVLEDDVAGRSLGVTRIDQRPMTPEYASPEQIRGEVITTSSDIYSLGVVLYELLSGRRPHSFNSHSLTEFERVICEVEPMPPSQAVATPNTDTAPRCGLDPRQLRRTLAGDIDTIILKALRKEPQRRYSTVEQFSDDIQRYVDGRPVLARSGARLYRARKFIRRNRWAVALVTTVFLALSTIALVTSNQSRRLDRERKAALDAKQIAQENNVRAEAEANRTRTALRSFRDVLALTDPNEANTRQISARELLDQAAERIHSQHADQPDVEAALQVTIGTAYQNLGLLEQAETHLQRAVDLCERLDSSPNMQLSESLSALGVLRHRQGKLPEAEILLRRALDMGRQLGAGHYSELTVLLATLGSLRNTQGDLKEAESLLREALSLAKKQFGDDHRYVAVSKGELGHLLRERGNYEEAESMYREALAFHESQQDSRTADYTAILNSLGELLARQKRCPEAEPMLRKALDACTTIFGREHANTAFVLNNLGNLYQDCGNAGEAEAAYRESLSIRRKLLGDRNLEVATSLNNLGSLLNAQGRLDEGEAELRNAIDIYQENVGDKDWRVANSRSHLGECLIRQERYSDAEKELVASVKGLRSTLGPDHPASQRAIKRLVRVYEALEKPEKVEKYRALLIAPQPTSTPSPG